MPLTLLVFGLTTGFESAGIFLWLKSHLAGRPLEGYAFLLAGELLELAVFVYYLQKTASGPKERSPVRVIGAMALIAVFESLIWIIWISVYFHLGIVLATIILALLMHLKHDADVAAVSDTALFRQLFTRKGITATSLEIIGATLLLLLVRDDRWLAGAGAFFVCNAVEHLVGGIIVGEALGGRGFLTSNMLREHEQSALTVIVPVKPDAVEALRRTLEEIGNNVEGDRRAQFRKSPSTHFARWAILDHNKRLGPRLLFSSNYDGDLRSYADELARTAGAGMEEVWSACEGYAPGTAADGERLLAFFRRYSEPVQAFYVACRGARAVEILDSIKLRDQLNAQLDGPDAAATVEALSKLVPNTPPPAPASAPLASQDSWVARLGERLAGIRGGPPSRHRRMRADDELVKIEDRGVQNQMTVVSDVKPGIWPRLFLRLVLLLIAAHARQARGSLSGLTTIHFARWVIIDDGDYLLFESNYDGSWESYIDEFVDFASTGMNLIWGTAVKFPAAGSRDIEAFKEIIRRYQRPSQVFYSAYPNSTVRNNLNDLGLSRAVRTGEPDESVRRFLSGSYGSAL